MVDPRESREQRLYALFQNCVEQPAERRREYGAAECGEDEDLLRDLFALLREYESEADPVLTDAPEFASKPRFPTKFVGEMVGRYKILRELGAGGMGAVFLAQQEEPVRRKVALKVIRPGLDEEEVVRRFEAEAQALAMMDHPLIARVFDADVTDDGRPYFIMEYVDGARPITEHARSGGLARDGRLRLFSTVCDAVHHGHQKGVIHRDLKPANILVDGEGRAKIIDFGIARTFGDGPTGATLTQLGQLLGTPEYMSPEQCAGDSRRIDVRSDVYSLGVVLYELLTGSLPHDLREKSVVEATRVILEDPPRPATTHGLRLPSDLDVVVMKALEKDQEQRYQSAREFALDVTRVLDGEPIAARPPSVRRQLQVFARRHRFLVSAAAIFVLFLLITIVVSTRFAWIASRAREAEHLRNEELSDVLYGQQIQLAGSALLRSEADEARRLLDSVGEDRRSFEWHYLSARCDRSLVSLRVAEESVIDVGFSDEGDVIETVGTRGELVRIDAATGQRIGPDRQLALAPQDARIDLGRGKVITAHADRRVRCWDLRTGEEQWASAPFPHRALRLAWGPGLVGVTGGGENRVWTLDDRSGERAETYGPFSRSVQSMAVSPDARVLAIRTDQESVLIQRGEGGDSIQLPIRSRGPVAFDHSGERVAAIDRGRVSIFAVSTGEPLQHGDPIPKPTHRIAWTPNDEQIVAADDSGSIHMIDVKSGRLVSTSLSHGATAVALDTSRSGRIATGDVEGVVQLWDGTRDFSIHPSNDVMFAVGTDPGLRLGITVGWGTAKLWDLQSGTERWTKSLYRWYVNDAAITADGAKAVVAADEGVSLLQMSDGSVLARMDTAANWSRVAFSRSGDTVFVGGSDGQIVALDGTTLERRFSLSAHESAVRSIAVSPSGDLVVSGSGDPGGSVPAQSSRFPGGPASLSAVSAADGTERWRLDTPALSVMALAFSPDGAVLACAGMDGAIRLRDPSDGRERVTLERREAPVTSLAFSPDGERLVCGGPERGLRVYDTRSWRRVVSLDTDSVGHYLLAFSSDGTRLLAHSADSSTLRFLELGVSPDVVRARGRAGAARAALDGMRVGSRLTRRIVQALNDHPSMSDDVRRDAIRLAEGRGENVNYLNSDAWGFVTLFGLPKEDYEHALELARRAVSLRPETTTFWNTLGIAEFHAGRWEQALETLTRSDLAHRADEDDPLSAEPLDVLGLALTYHALGRSVEAQQELARAKAIVRARGGEPKLDLARFLREAESAIQTVE